MGHDPLIFSNTKGGKPPRTSTGSWIIEQLWSQGPSAQRTGHLPPHHRHDASQERDAAASTSTASECSRQPPGCHRSRLRVDRRGGLMVGACREIAGRPRRLACTALFSRGFQEDSQHALARSVRSVRVATSTMPARAASRQPPHALARRGSRCGSRYFKSC